MAIISWTAALCRDYNRFFIGVIFWLLQAALCYVYYCYTSYIIIVIIIISMLGWGLEIWTNVHNSTYY